VSVNRLRDGRWCVHYRTAAGSISREYFGRGPEGERAARDRQQELSLRPYVKRTPAAGAALFAELAKAYYEAARARLQQTSLSALAYKLDRFYIPALGHLPAAHVTPDRIDKYVADRLKTVSRSTVHRELSDICAILSWAASRRYILANPLAGYRKPPRDDAVIAPPTVDELGRILAASAGHLRRALQLAFYTGIRPGRRELLSRKWSDVDLHRGTLFIESARKGGPVTRAIALHPELRALLAAWQAADINLQPPPEYLVHYGVGHKPVGSLKTAWAAALRRAGITRRLRLYDVRHTFATLAIQSSGDMRTISEIMGHSRPDTTLKVYSHSDLLAQQRALDKLPRIP
jgi:integrase